MTLNDRLKINAVGNLAILALFLWLRWDAASLFSFGCLVESVSVLFLLDD